MKNERVLGLKIPMIDLNELFEHQLANNPGKTQEYIDFCKIWLEERAAGSKTRTSLLASKLEYMNSRVGIQLLNFEIMNHGSNFKDRSRYHLGEVWADELHTINEQYPGYSVSKPINNSGLPLFFKIES